MAIVRYILASAALAVLIGCTQPGGVGAVAETGMPTYRCRRATGPIVIDGKLDDEAWEQAPSSAEFIRNIFEKVYEMPALLSTSMKLLYDDDNLYIAFECIDSDIWSTFTDRDDPVMFEEAAVLYIDPLGHGRDYYGFYINPLNALLDLKRRDGSPDMLRRIWLNAVAWNAEGIEHAVQVNGSVNNRSDTDEGWSVEIRLPFDALGVRPLPGERWRMQAGRFTRPKFSGCVICSWTKSLPLHAPHSFGALQFQP